MSTPNNKNKVGSNNKDSSSSAAPQGTSASPSSPNFANDDDNVEQLVAGSPMVPTIAPGQAQESRARLRQFPTSSSASNVRNSHPMTTRLHNNTPATGNASNTNVVTNNNNPNVPARSVTPNITTNSNNNPAPTSNLLNKISINGNANNPTRTPLTSAAATAARTSTTSAVVLAGTPAPTPSTSSTTANNTSSNNNSTVPTHSGHESENKQLHVHRDLESGCLEAILGFNNATVASTSGLAPSQQIQRIILDPNIPLQTRLFTFVSYKLIRLYSRVGQIEEAVSNINCKRHKPDLTSNSAPASASAPAPASASAAASAPAFSASLGARGTSISTSSQAESASNNTSATENDVSSESGTAVDVSVSNNNSLIAQADSIESSCIIVKVMSKKGKNVGSKPSRHRCVNRCGPHVRTCFKCETHQLYLCPSCLVRHKQAHPTKLSSSEDGRGGDSGDESQS
jgi:hypothetical protein